MYFSMMVDPVKGRLSRFFSAAAAACALAASAPVWAEDNDFYRKIDDAGVKIPIAEYAERLSPTFMRFKVKTSDVPVSQYLWAQIAGGNFAYYLKGTEPEDRWCPYIPKEVQTCYRRETAGDTHTITMGVPENIIDEVFSKKCAISPSPDKEGDDQKIFEKGDCSAAAPSP